MHRIYDFRPMCRVLEVVNYGARQILITDCNSTITNIDCARKINKSKVVIISFKSAVARDHSIDMKRLKRDVTVKKTFSSDVSGNYSM